MRANLILGLGLGLGLCTAAYAEDFEDEEKSTDAEGSEEFSEGENSEGSEEITVDVELSENKKTTTNSKDSKAKEIASSTSASDAPSLSMPSGGVSLGIGLGSRTAVYAEESEKIAAYAEESEKIAAYAEESEKIAAYAKNSKSKEKTAYAEDSKGKEKTADASAFDAPVLNTPNSDELGSFMDGWEFGFHGYIRMAMRTNDSFFGDRPPYLIDDRYYKSGFAYTRLNEGSWAETQFSASRKNTRIVVGMFASEFSDWSKVTMEDQKGFAIGYVEQKWHPWEPIEFKLKAGMFWERFGYLEAYDTYLFGRTHIAGAALEARAFDGLVYAQYGHGAHLREANQGFTTLDWVRVGSDWKFADLSLYGMWVGSQDNDYAFNEDWKGTDGHLRILGADVKGAVPYFGKVYAALAYYSAESVGYLHGAVEVMHAADGSTLKNNYFGSVNNGTGEMQAIAWRADWEVHRTIDAFASRELASMFNGLNVSLFGLTAYVAADTKNKEDPKNNYNDRRYFKWGSELRYAPLAFDINPMPFVSVRYDRVILDTNHEGLSFNAITPRIGITPYKGIDVFLSYSHYDYGENIYTPNEVTQAVGTNVRPDEDVYKIQAQASW